MWTLSQKKYASSARGIEARTRFQISERGIALKLKYLAQRKAKRQEQKSLKNSLSSQPKTEEIIVDNTKNIIK